MEALIADRFMTHRKNYPLIGPLSIVGDSTPIPFASAHSFNYSAEISIEIFSWKTATQLFSSIQSWMIISHNLQDVLTLNVSVRVKNSFTINNFPQPNVLHSVSFIV